MRFLALLIAPALFGQVSLTLSGPAEVQRGGTLAVVVMSGGATSTGPAGWQWTFAPPAGFTVLSVTPGTRAVAAGKSVTCWTGNLKCLAWGGNSVIANGQLALITMQVPATAVVGAPAVFSLTSRIAVGSTGSELPTTADLVVRIR
jgi:hypothetical protein